MGFPRKEYWSGWPFPSPGDLPSPGIKPTSPAFQADSLPLSHLGTSYQVSNIKKKTLGEGEGGMFREISIEPCILSRVKQIARPGWMHETSAQGWCTGMTQRDRVERVVGGGSGWGTHVNPWLIHVNVWQKPLQYCNIISLQLIKINGKK